MKFELYKDKDCDCYWIAYDLDILRDNFFFSSSLLAIDHIQISSKKVDNILKKTSILTELSRKEKGEDRSQNVITIPYVSWIKGFPANEQLLESTVELLNSVLPGHRKLIFDQRDLEVSYPSWLSSATWRRKILGL